MKILISGTNSGIAKYLLRELGGMGFDKDCSRLRWKRIRAYAPDVIIHCAFNSARDVDSGSLYGYLSDNVLLTRELVSLKHKKFIFFSSADVYPKDNKPHSEDEIIALGDAGNIYAVTKLMSEAIVRSCCRDYLILRPSAMLGDYSRQNTILKIIKEKKCRVTVTPGSRFNFVLYKDILAFLRFAIKRGIKGAYNIASSGNITIGEAAARMGRRVRFGSYHYDVGRIDNRKLLSVFPAFDKSSWRVIKEFLGGSDNG